MTWLSRDTVAASGCRQHLVIYKAPNPIESVAGLPKSAVGKVLLRELARHHIQNRERSCARGVQGLLTILMTYITETGTKLTDRMTRAIYDPPCSVIIEPARLASNISSSPMSG